MTATAPRTPDEPAVERPDGGAFAAEVDFEQRHLDRALTRLEELRQQAIAHERSSQRLTGSTPQAVYERDVTALAAASRRLDLETAGEGLVFGRLDRTDGEVLHVGRMGLRTEQQEPVVVDWRAPAAAPFYQATSKDPQGVVRRRTITTSRERVVGVDDELLDPDADLSGTVVVGDGAFFAALTRERGPQMRDIVATIQAEQDLAVRAPDDGALLVTGGPGTGKTAVALHRVAYLMYARRDWYSRRGVLVVGPSAVFVDYIAAVLPALGETGVRLASLGQLPVLPRGRTADATESPEAAVVKGSAKMAQLLRRVVRELADGPPAARRRTVSGEMQDGPDLFGLDDGPGGRPPDGGAGGSAGGGVALTTGRWGTPLEVPAADLARRRMQVRRSARSHNGGRAAFAKAVVDAAWAQWEGRPGAGRLEADDREEFGSWLRGDSSYETVLDRMWPVLLPEQVLDQLRAGALPLERLARGLYSGRETQLLTGRGELTASDAAMLDELQELIGAPPEPERDDDDDWNEADELDELARASEVTTFADRNRRAARGTDDAGYRTYAHVVVDEAQDVTPMQWRMIARRARGATWTVVGDWAQSAWPDVQEVRDALHEVLRRARVREVELRTNYRTSTEVAALAGRVLAVIDPQAQPPTAVRQTGVSPRLLTGGLDQLAGEVDLLLSQVSGTVGVVCPHDLVSAAQRVLVDAGPRVRVFNSWQVKGLEFDGCLVLDPEGVVRGARTRASGMRTLYVALTRATQRLTVLSDRPLEQLLDAA